MFIKCGESFILCVCDSAETMILIVKSPGVWLVELTYMSPYNHEMHPHIAFRDSPFEAALKGHYSMKTQDDFQ